MSVAHFLRKYVDMYHVSLRVDHFLRLFGNWAKQAGAWMHIPVLLLLTAFILYIIAYKLWCWRERTRLLSGSQYVQTNCGCLEYRWYGSGPVVLVLHDAPGGSDVGKLWHELLGGNQFSVLAPSRFGYLGSSQCSPTLSDQASAIVELLENLDLAKVAVIAIGAAGPLALEIARAYPQRVWSLALIGAIAHKWQLPESEQLKSEMDIVEQFCFSQMKGLLMWTYYLSLRYFPGLILPALYADNSFLDDKVVSKYVDSIWSDPVQLLRAERILRASLPLDMREGGMERDFALCQELSEKPTCLENIVVPSLIVHGRTDTNVPFSHAEAAKEAIGTNSELYAIEEGTHFLWLGEEGQLVSRKLISFLMGQLVPDDVSVFRHYAPSTRKASHTRKGRHTKRAKDE